MDDVVSRTLGPLGTRRYPYGTFQKMASLARAR
jgi:hypothetical protein